MRDIVGHLGSTIDKAVRAYVPKPSPVIYDRAKLIAAKAVRSFQPGRGANIHTHVYRQLQALQQMAPRMQDPLPMPERLRRDRGEVVKSIEQVTNDLGREPSDEEISQLSNLPVRRVTKVRRMMRTGMPLSVVEESGEDDDEAPDPVSNKRDPMDDWVDAVYHDLGDIDRVILQYRTGYRGVGVVSNQEIAKKLRMSPQAVSQRASRIQAKLDEFHAPN